MQDSGITRRDFLKGSAVAVAAASAGILASGRTAAQTAKTPDLVRAAIIGSGSQGTMLLGNAVKIPRVKFVAVCDIYDPHREKALVVAEGAEGYTDYRKMLERKDIDAVIIATPLYLHSPIAVDAMDAGKHVFCEKMMAYSIDQAKAMARKSKDTHKLLQIGHQRHVNPNYTHAYDMLNKEKVLGTITQVRAQWHRNGSWRRAIPDPKFEKLLNWRMYKEFSHGLMAELGSHQIDVANWFLNARPLSVMGIGGIDYWKDGRTTYDNVSVMFEYPNGVKCTYTSITTNAFDNCSEEFMGDQGTLQITTDKALLYREARAEKLVWAPMAQKQMESGKEAIILDAGATRKDRERAKGETVTQEAKHDDYYTELEQYFDSVRTGKKPACGAQEALNACVPCILANEAIAKGKKITIKPEYYEI